MCDVDRSRKSRPAGLLEAMAKWNTEERGNHQGPTPNKPGNPNRVGYFELRGHHWNTKSRFYWLSQHIVVTGLLFFLLPVSVHSVLQDAVQHFSRWPRGRVSLPSRGARDQPAAEDGRGGTQAAGAEQPLEDRGGCQGCCCCRLWGRGGAVA